MKQKGSLTIPLLTTTATFLIIIYSLLFLLVNQFNFTWRQEASEEALNIAEAGANYYRWHLAHAPEDFQDGTGQTGPYVHEYHDPEGSLDGQFSLEITPPDAGSTIVTVKSTGWRKDFSGVKRTITARYGIPSMASYSFLNNGSIWFGSGITVHGLVHCNNGIRMDGVNTSLVTSGRETYTCGSETGCSPPTEKPGVWGSGPGGDQGLWQFPVPQIDYDSIALDFIAMRDEAQADGLYLAPSGSQGYHLIFSADGQVSVRRVTSTGYYYGYSVEGGCERLYQNITGETSIGNYSLAEVPIIFAEDYLWLEGTVNGRTTVAAARFPLDVNNINIWIYNNLRYESHDGSDSLGVMAQNDIYFARNIPTDFVVEGALLAKKGHIIRHGYLSFCGWSSYAVRNSLTIYGSLTSNLKSYWNFGTSPSSGFRTRTTTYDNNLLYEPPPYYPTSGEYELLYWSED
ncbi:hypothetical protein KKD62_01215 [Patescibacteria group bacterium]|nr:hypothetical protein [Patescibacteria group bacterium]MBU1931431.1 hypothetical protein [Patescibacteria group bacterium]